MIKCSRKVADEILSSVALEFSSENGMRASGRSAHAKGYERQLSGCLKGNARPLSMAASATPEGGGLSRSAQGLAVEGSDVLSVSWPGGPCVPSEVIRVGLV